MASPIERESATRKLPALGPDDEHLALVDLLDRLMTGGVVLTGDLILSVAGVDLVYLGLRLVLSSVAALGGEQGPSAGGAP